MTINNYYRQQWAPVGVDPYILEKGLGAKIEPEAQRAIKRLLSSPQELTDIDSAALLTYIEFQRLRVPKQAQLAAELIRSTILTLSPPDVVSAIHRGEMTLTIKDSARFEYVRTLLGQLYPWFAHMQWEVIEAESGSAFATTDNPVTLHNADVIPPAEPGIALAGTIVLFPLSSRYLLLMRHPEYRSGGARLERLPDPVLPEKGRLSVTFGRVWDLAKVNGHNWNMLQRSDRIAVAESRRVLDQCMEDTFSGG